MNPILVMLGLLAAMAVVHWLLRHAASQAVAMGVLITLAFYSSPCHWS